MTDPEIKLIEERFREWPQLRPVFYEIRRLQERERELEGAKNGAYSERNLMVAFLTGLYPSHLCRHPDADMEWENDWRWIVCVHGPAGQMTWHIHDSEHWLFKHLEVQDRHWDEHTTEEKYRRLTNCHDAARQGGKGDR